MLIFTFLSVYFISMKSLKKVKLFFHVLKAENIWIACLKARTMYGKY